LFGGINIDRKNLQPGFREVLDFKLVDALFGRRARRFFLGAEIPDGISNINQSMTFFLLPKKNK